MEDAPQHNERDDQNANCSQDTGGRRYVILCNKTLSGTSESRTLFIGSGCHVLIAQIHQGGRSFASCRIGQCENLGGDTEEGTQGSVALVQVLERPVEGQEDDNSQGAGSQPQDLFEYVERPV